MTRGHFFFHCGYLFKGIRNFKESVTMKPVIETSGLAPPQVTDYNEP